MLSGGASLANGSVVRSTIPALPPLSTSHTVQSPQFPQADSLPIVNNLNTTVTSLGNYYRITKSSGTATYDADAISSVAVFGDFVLRFQLSSVTSGGMAIGVSVNPTADSDYHSIDRCLLLNPSDAIYAIELGAPAITWTTNISASNYYFMRRVGSAITAWVGTSSDISAATQFATFTSLSGPVYFDSSFVAVGDYADVAFLDGGITAATGQALGSTALAFTPSGAEAAAGSLVGTSALLFTPSGAESASLLAAGSSAVTFGPTGTANVKTPVVASTALLFTPGGAETASATAVGASTLTFGPTGAETAKASEVGTSTLIFTPTGAESAKASETGTSALTFGTTANISGSGALSQIVGTSSVVFTPAGAETAKAAAIASTALTFSSAGNVYALAGLSGSAAFIAVCSASISGSGWAPVPTPSGNWTTEPSPTASWTNPPPPNRSWSTESNPTSTWTTEPLPTNRLS